MKFCTLQKVLQKSCPRTFSLSSMPAKCCKNCSLKLGICITILPFRGANEHAKYSLC